MKLFRLLLCLSALLCDISLASVIKSPSGHHSSAWSSFTVNTALGQLLRLARNTPPKVTPNGAIEYWEYFAANGDRFTLAVVSGARTIKASVCSLDDQAFNALTRGGHQFAKVAVDSADGLYAFLVNLAPKFGDAGGNVADEDSVDLAGVLVPDTTADGARNETGIDNGSDGSSSSSTKRSLEKRLHVHHCPSALERREIASDNSTADGGADDERRPGVVVTGWVGLGCTGQQIYYHNEIGPCHQFDEHQAAGALVLNAHSSRDHVVVFSDRHCDKRVGTLEAHVCVPVGRTGYRSYRIRRG
jgi:hypothetical protein